MNSFMTIKEFADLMGVSRSTVTVWRRDGVAPAEINIGKTVRFSQAAVQEWLEQNQRAA